MRFLQAIILLIFLGMLGLFAVQNTEDITVTFWTWKITGPVALLTIAAYVLGMLSGWTVVSFFTRSCCGACRSDPRIDPRQHVAGGHPAGRPGCYELFDSLP